MCFFDQTVYACGDFKWGSFRQHCAKEYRTGETCGMKLVMNNVYVERKCTICDKLEVKYRKRAKLEDDIKRWKRERGGRRLNHTIDKAEDDIAALDQAIASLQGERYERQCRLN
jgi:hypothetical protein